MWEILKGFAEQVTEYSTVFGRIWYLCVFLFRGMVVVTIGGDVYSDEQSEFKCSTQEVGCENVCFSKFSKISHIRFWAFQLLAVTTPTILFHFFALDVKTKLEKLKSKLTESYDYADSSCWLEDDRIVKVNKKGTLNTSRTRVRKPTRVHFKSVYDSGSNNLKQVAFTDSIYFAYYISVIVRAATEGLFIYLSYELFRFMDRGQDTDLYGAMEFLWFRVPVGYKCEGPDVKSACGQHLAFGDEGYVPCWISRPWEKTIFIRYMNVLSAICFVISVVEFIYLSARGTRTAKRRRVRKRNESRASEYEQQTAIPIPQLAVPIRYSSIEHFGRSKDMYESDDENTSNRIV